MTYVEWTIIQLVSSDQILSNVIVSHLPPISRKRTPFISWWKVCHCHIFVPRNGVTEYWWHIMKYTWRMEMEVEMWTKKEVSLILQFLHCFELVFAMLSPSIRWQIGTRSFWILLENIKKKSTSHTFLCFGSEWCNPNHIESYMICWRSMMDGVNLHV
jgi:hypothetical protein